MAAYGALVSLMNIIDRIEKHPSPPISIHKTQVESLTQNITFLQEFLDGSDNHEVNPLERRIADAVYAAEDVIESQIVVQIDRRSKGKKVSFINSFQSICKCASTSSITIEEDFYHDLQQVLEEMNLIKKEAMETLAEAEPREVSSTHAPSSSTTKENVMVGFEEVFDEVLDMLTGDQANRPIIPIVGMGGIGKTTLARNLFENALVKEHFDIRAWTTISQTYNVKQTLIGVYIQVSGHSRDPNEKEKLSDKSENEKLSDKSENELGEMLRKYLFGRRYLVIMDDMWSIEVWEKINFFFPDNGNGSRIIVTTRLSNLSSQLNESYRVGMKTLDGASSWVLFCKIVVGGESIPHDFESIGRNIVASCKGLPLSIAIIGGLLAKSKRTRKYWQRIEQNLTSIVINNNDKFCLKILRLSYIYLPNYLKPCFLYMGVFEEDCRIRVSMLEKLWISEGFLKPMSGKCFETIAEEYFKELVDRNLILVDELGCLGNVKYCRIHDLLRDLCLKEVEKERFYHVIKDGRPANNRERRVIFPMGTSLELIRKGLGSLSHARSIICDQKVRHLPHNLRLVRTFKAYDGHTRLHDLLLNNVFELVNSRYLDVNVNNPYQYRKIPSSIDLLWNLHTLIIHSVSNLIAPIEIWKLHQLRHLVFEEGKGILPTPPPSCHHDIVVMDNLETLKGVENFFLNEEVVKRIPNVKKLHLYYDESKLVTGHLHYLGELSKLENLSCSTVCGNDECWEWIRFPHSLKKLCVISSGSAYSNLELGDIMPKIGSLPLLEKFVLKHGFNTRKWKWETIEGHFPNLKFLKLWACDGIEDWIVSDKSHFPLLQKLHLRLLRQLKEIPSEIGEIPTLKSIVVEGCRKSVVKSALQIIKEQEESYGQSDLRVRVVVVGKNEGEELKSSASANFQVDMRDYLCLNDW